MDNPEQGQPWRYRHQSPLTPKTLEHWGRIAGEDDGYELTAGRSWLSSDIDLPLRAVLSDLAKALEGVELPTPAASALRGLVAAAVLLDKRYQGATDILWALFQEGASLQKAAEEIRTQQPHLDYMLTEGGTWALPSKNPAIAEEMKALAERLGELAQELEE